MRKENEKKKGSIKLSGHTPTDIEGQRELVDNVQCRRIYQVGMRGVGWSVGSNFGKYVQRRAVHRSIFGDEDLPGKICMIWLMVPGGRRTICMT